MAAALFIACLMGFVGSMPPAGPIALLVADRGLRGRGREGLLLAAGAALPEAAYAGLAALGLSAVLPRWPHLVPVSRVIAGLVVATVGALLALRPATPRSGPDPTAGGRKDFVLGLIIAALNPTFLATWAGAVAVVHATGIVDITPRIAPVFAAGVLVGNLGWFMLLLWLVGRYRERFRREVLERVVRLMGAVLVVMGLAFVVRSVARLVG